MAGEVSDYGIYLSVGTLVSLVGAVAAGVWKFADIEKSNREDSLKADERLRDELIKVEREGNARGDVLRRETGEMGAAIRQKIHEIEVFSRDHFVTATSFDAAMNRIESSIEKLGERLEQKIDRLNGHTSSRPSRK